MLYLLDANVLITAERDYYGFEQVPQFWDWLVDMGKAGHIKLPYEIHKEIADGRGDLKDWIVQAEVKDALILDEEADQGIVNDVLEQGYGENLTDSEIEKIGRDPFLVAYALAQPDRCVVSKEVSSPKKQRANRKVPDVCADVGAKIMKDFDLYKALGFKAK